MCVFGLPMLAAQQLSPCSAPLGMRIVAMLAIATVLERAIRRREQSKIDFPQWKIKIIPFFSFLFSDLTNALHPLPPSLSLVQQIIGGLAQRADQAGPCLETAKYHGGSRRLQGPPSRNPQANKDA